MKANSFPALIIITFVAGVIVFALGGGLGGALLAMVITFALVGWFGPKALLLGLIAGLWGMFIEILKGINPMNDKW